MSNTDDEDDKPVWERGRLRTHLYQSVSRDGAPCEALWTLVFPGNKGDNGYIRRYDFCDHTTESYGDWDNLTKAEGLKQLADLEATALRDFTRAAETPEKIARNSLSLNQMTLETFHALETNSAAAVSLKENITVGRPLQLGAPRMIALPQPLRLKTTA
jgi:hypothetical protein